MCELWSALSRCRPSQHSGKTMRTPSSPLSHCLGGFGFPPPVSRRPPLPETYFGLRAVTFKSAGDGLDRKSVVEGKRVGFGGGRIIKKKKTHYITAVSV